MGLRQFHVRGLGEGANGNAMGLPHLELAAVDPSEETSDRSHELGK